MLLDELQSELIEFIASIDVVAAIKLLGTSTVLREAAKRRNKYAFVSLRLAAKGVVSKTVLLDARLVGSGWSLEAVTRSLGEFPHPETRWDMRHFDTFMYSTVHASRRGVGYGMKFVVDGCTIANLFASSGKPWVSALAPGSAVVNVGEQHHTESELHAPIEFFHKISQLKTQAGNPENATHTSSDLSMLQQTTSHNIFLNIKFSPNLLRTNETAKGDTCTFLFEMEATLGCMQCSMPPRPPLVWLHNISMRKARVAMH